MTIEFNSLLPFTHIQFDWFQSPLLVSQPKYINERLDEEGRLINQNSFWIMNDNEEIRLDIKLEENRNQGPSGDVQTINQESDQSNRQFGVSNNSVEKHQTGPGNIIIEKQSSLLNRDSIPHWNFQYDKGSRCLNIYNDSNKLVQKFIHECQVYENIHGMNRMPINDLDISEGGELGVSASRDGSVRVWSTKSGIPMRDLSRQSGDKVPKGHVGDVYVSKFLPSGEVVMTGGADTQILIWRIADSLCAASLIGHQAGITSFSFIERGRNFVSSSRDGTVRLWDCASQSCISTIVSSKSRNSINQCAVRRNSSISLGEIDAQSPKDFGTEGYVGTCAIDDGRCIFYDVRHRKIISTLKHNSALMTCSFLDNFVTVGQKNGEIIQYDVRMIKNTDCSPLYKYSSTTSPVLKVVSGWNGSPTSIWFSCQDGSVRNVDFANFSPNISLSGFDCDPVFGLSLYKNHIYCGGRDGRVKHYVI